MLPTKDRIDSHVHFYTLHDLQRVAGRLPYELPNPHPLTAYLDHLIDSGVNPAVINNVHLSILPDSENVFASFRELDELQNNNPARYGAIKLVGTIKADPEYATLERLSHPQVVGVRIVLHDAKPESVTATQYSSAPWLQLYSRLGATQHIHIYAKEAETNYLVLKQIPEPVRVVIDHLGICHGECGTSEPAYLSLLAEARRRGNVWFKGPGYRTSANAREVAGVVARIVREVGAERILLEATDAPHVGSTHDGTAYESLFDLRKVYSFVDNVAKHASAETGTTPQELLHGAVGLLNR